MFGLTSLSPPRAPPNAPRWSSSLTTLFGLGGGGGNAGAAAAGDEAWGAEAGGAGGGAAVSGGGGAVADAEDDPLPLDILPGNKQPLAIDRRVDDLLRLLRPAPRAEGYRRSVFCFVTRQVRACVCLCVCFFRLRLSRLPTDQGTDVFSFVRGR